MCKPFNNWRASLSSRTPSFEAAARRVLGRRTEGQRALWRQGISGDLPIVVLMIGHLRDMEVVREILTAHTFWHLRGLKVDLVLVSDEAPSYDEPLTGHLRRLTEAQVHLTGVDQPGGVYLRSATKISKEELARTSSGCTDGAGRSARHIAPTTCRQRTNGCETAATAARAPVPRRALGASGFHGTEIL